MAIVVVDSSTIISCAMNCLMWVFKELKQRGFRFIVPIGVKKEIIDSGLSSERFKYEAIRVSKYFADETFEVYKNEIKRQTSELLNYANSSFYIKGNPLRILQEADAEVAALAKHINADAILTDERTLRLLIEAPDLIKGNLERKFHERVKVNEKMLHSFGKGFEKIQIIRSVDLMALAYYLGIFDQLMKKCYISEIKDCEKTTIEGVLYALKFAGCAVSFKEINDYVNLLR